MVSLQRIQAAMLPPGLKSEIIQGAWTVLPVFKWLQKLGSIDDSEMSRVFNMGLGLVLVVKPDVASEVLKALSEMNLENWEIGKITNV